MILFPVIVRICYIAAKFRGDNYANLLIFKNIYAN